MTEARTTDPAEILPDIDLYEPSLAENVHEVLAHARSQCPVTHSSAHGGYWLVTKYDDVKAVLTDDKTFSNAHGITVPYSPSKVPMPPLYVDAPIHRDFRKLLNPFLTPGALAPHRDSLRAAAVELIEKFVDRGRCEALTELAMPLPATGLARIVLGLKDEDKIHEVQATAMLSAQNDPRAYAAVRETAIEVLNIRREENARAGGPQQKDLLNSLLTGSVEGRPLTEEERIGTLMITLLGGLDTTTNSISNTIHYLATTPGLEERVRDPKWFSTALDEFLRLETPVAYTARYVAQDTEVGGKKLRAGEWVVAHMASANRDGDEFPGADRLDFERESNRHLAFGVGRHRCLGSNLARMQIAVTFEELLSRVENIRLAPNTEVTYSSGMSRKPKRLDIEFDRR